MKNKIWDSLIKEEIDFLENINYNERMWKVYYEFSKK